MTATATKLDAAKRKLTMLAESIEVLPERVRAEWNEVLNDSGRDVAIGWRVHRKPVNARPIVQRHFHERLLRIRRIFAGEMQIARDLMVDAVAVEAGVEELRHRWPGTDLTAFPFLDASAILTDMLLPPPASMASATVQRHAVDELRRRCEPLMSTPLRGYGMRLRDWARRRMHAVADPFGEVVANTSVLNGDVSPSPIQ